MNTDVCAPDRNRQPKLVTRKQSVGHEEVACPVRPTPNRQVVPPYPASYSARSRHKPQHRRENSIETLGNSPVVRIGSSCRLLDCTVGLSEMPGLEHARCQSNNRRRRTRCDRRTQAPAQVLLKILARDAESFRRHRVQGGPQGHSEAEESRGHAGRPPVSRSTRIICSFSTCSSVLLPAGSNASRRISAKGARRSGPRERMTALSMKFSSSHSPLPGHRPAHQRPHRVRRYLFESAYSFPGRTFV